MAKGTKKMLDQKKCPTVGEMAPLGKTKDLSSVSRMHAKKFPALRGRDGLASWFVN